MVTIFRASKVQAAAMMAFVEAIAGMMFFTTPAVSWSVTPYMESTSISKEAKAMREAEASILPARPSLFGNTSSSLFHSHWAERKPTGK